MDCACRALIALVILAGSACGSGVLYDKAGEAAERREIFVAGDGGWRFLPAELKFAAKLASPDLGQMIAPAVTAITDFAQQMRQAGIELILMPVPPKVLLQAPTLGVPAEEQEKMRAGWEAIMKELSGTGVKVVDLAPDFASAESNPFCLRDTHWSGRGIALAVDRLRPLLEGSGVVAGPGPGPGGSWTARTIQGDLGGDPEPVELLVNATTTDPAAMKKSPLLLLGDSHILVFHQGGELHTKGAGLPDQIANALGVVPDVIGVLGSGATSSRYQLARRVRADEAYLDSKKAIVWCFAGREFTEAEAWKKVPLRRAPKP